MAEIGRWLDHVFEVSPYLVRSFSGLEIKGGAETESKTSGKQKYLAYKAGNPYEVKLTLHLNAALGCDVRAEAAALIRQAQAGEKGYFYVGAQKLLPCQLMLTEASAKEIQISPGGSWVSADVEVGFKQCDKGDGTADESGSRRRGSRKASARGGSPVQGVGTGVANLSVMVSAAANRAANPVVKPAAKAKLQAAPKRTIAAARKGPNKSRQITIGGGVKRTKTYR